MDRGRHCGAFAGGASQDVALSNGIAALASAHGIDDATIARAEIVATVRLLGEVIRGSGDRHCLFVSLIVAGGGKLDGGIGRSWAWCCLAWWRRFSWGSSPPLAEGGAARADELCSWRSWWHLGSHELLLPRGGTSSIPGAPRAHLADPHLGARVSAHDVPLVTLHKGAPSRRPPHQLGAARFPGSGLGFTRGRHTRRWNAGDRQASRGCRAERLGTGHRRRTRSGRDPSLRARIGVTLETPRLPSAHQVGDLLAEIDLLRGAQGTARTLERFGLSQWSGRKLSGLSRRELRALDLVIATNTPDPIALLLTEPGADIAPVNRQALRETLARFAEAGACVLIITASMSDAIELADNVHVLERGKIVRWVPVSDTAALVPGRGIELRVEVDLPAFARSSPRRRSRGQRYRLGSARAPLGSVDPRRRSRSDRARGGSRCNRRRCEREVDCAGRAGLDEVRAAASGLALAAYHAAYRSYLEQDAQRGTTGA